MLQKEIVEAALIKAGWKQAASPLGSINFERCYKKGVWMICLNDTNKGLGPFCCFRRYRRGRATAWHGRGDALAMILKRVLL